MKNISKQINSLLPFEGAYALAKITDITPETLKVLDKSDREEFAEITNRDRQREYATSRHTLIKLSRTLGVSKLSIDKDELGQPYGLAGEEKYYISVAHTNRTVFCGITTANAIGLDLEPLDREVPHRLRSRILHPDEESAIRELELIRLWTIKEAYIKLRGQGLRLNMNEVEILEKDGAYWTELNNDKRAKICSFQSENNWLAVAHYL
jgi:phosphopantetheinyl transferase